MEDLNARLLACGKENKVFVVTDENVGRLYLNDLVKSLRDFKSDYYIAPMGEIAKGPKVYLDLVEKMVESELTRTDTVLALGGGTVGDLAGFAAATYLRGIDIVQLPTTLLAAVDSAIGGKTAINLDSGKNLLGAFHMPIFVHTDIRYFDTLNKDQIRDGLGEIIKYGMIIDEKLFDNLNDRDYFSGNIEEIVNICQNIKMDIVSQDEKDKGIRQILNFGHTIGHGIELLSNYKLGHGYCVALGMLMVTDYSVRKSYCHRDIYQALKELLEVYGFNTDLEKVFEENFTLPKDQWKNSLVEIMKRDKKRRGNHINLVVPEKIGKVRIEELSIEDLGELICVR